MREKVIGRRYWEKQCEFRSVREKGEYKSFNNTSESVALKRKERKSYCNKENYERQRRRNQRKKYYGCGHYKIGVYE